MLPRIGFKFEREKKLLQTHQKERQGDKLRKIERRRDMKKEKQNREMDRDWQRKRERKRKRKRSKQSETDRENIKDRQKDDEVALENMSSIKEVKVK